MTGWGNGYVFLPANHKWYGKPYEKVNANVHGGLTYSKQHGKFWVIGFDSAHGGDTQENCSKNWLITETTKLLDQAAKKSNFKKLNP